MKQEHRQPTPPVQTPVRESPVPIEFAEEIQRALELMRNVKRVQEARQNGDTHEDYGNTYILPKPIVYPASGST